MEKPEKAVLTIIDKSNIENQLELRIGLGLSSLKARKSPIEFDCLKADCGICIVKIISGHDSLSGKTSSEADFLLAMKADSDERLACQCRIFGDATIKIEF